LHAKYNSLYLDGGTGEAVYKAFILSLRLRRAGLRYGENAEPAFVVYANLPDWP
jgi:hypothetical protein